MPTESKAASDYLFVYGSLCRQHDGQLHPFLAGNAELLGEAHIAGQLYVIADYPGACLAAHSSSDRIHGELYRLHPVRSTLAVLDDYEECSAAFPPPHEYQRIRATVTLSDGQHFAAWLYVYNRSTAGLTRIQSGDYRHYSRLSA